MCFLVNALQLRSPNSIAIFTYCAIAQQYPFKLPLIFMYAIIPYNLIQTLSSRVFWYSLRVRLRCWCLFSTQSFSQTIIWECSWYSGFVWIGSVYHTTETQDSKNEETILHETLPWGGPGVGFGGEAAQDVFIFIYLWFCKLGD